jgi:hypothetical protein
VAQSEENPFYDNPLRVTLGIQLVIHFDKRASFDDRHLWKNFRVVLTPPDSEDTPTGCALDNAQGSWSNRKGPLSDNAGATARDR